MTHTEVLQAAQLVAIATGESYEHVLDTMERLVATGLNMGGGMTVSIYTNRGYGQTSGGWGALASIDASGVAAAHAQRGEVAP